MKKYLIYTTEGETIAPNDDISVDNCQVLGYSEGIDLSNAIDNLFKSNPLLTKAGFKKCNCIGVQIMFQSIKMIF